MENIAYLHLAFAYEDSEFGELAFLFHPAAVPDWKRLSSKAWKYMLPLVLILSIFSAVGSVLALEKGDQGPSVKNLQQKLNSAGFYRDPITEVYDSPTEDAVRQFQKAAGLPINGVVEVKTWQKLESWQKKPESKKTKTATAPTQRTTTSTPRSATNKRQNPNLITKGDEGENVKVLQARLRIAGFYFGNPSGIFGPITEEAVKRFQKAYKLSADGVVGPTTLAKLPPVNAESGEDTSQQEINRDQLSLGDRGEAVRILQEQLIKAGYLDGPPNGYYGSYTADAVSRFQKHHHLEANSIAGTTTRSKLHNLVKTSPKSDFNVLEVQMRLQEKGFYKGLLNGIMAEDTKKAIKRAQEFYGVSPGDIISGNF
ncbi:peptidoglycan-binding protein [Trichormus sp. NMC-1]|uniref:peptidoglycan-binding domain-containing protein n=1 Tax=Trichormus sp. NMC-1 TaxID=1853259 RepID=UPI0008DC1053|nr:peptidoglycan-binding protein [Trichormus sp. NMC-1]